jgi:phosphoglycolate phosphatase-like HAD superfamily hydrolase
VSRDRNGDAWMVGPKRADGCCAINLGVRFIGLATRLGEPGLYHPALTLEPDGRFPCEHG